MGRNSRSRSRSKSRNRSRDRNGSNEKDQEGFRVHVADLSVDCSQKEIESKFGKYGEFREVWLAKNPPCFSFIVFKHKSDAEEAIKEMDGRFILKLIYQKPYTHALINI